VPQVRSESQNLRLTLALLWVLVQQNQRMAVRAVVRAPRHLQCQWSIVLAPTLEINGEGGAGGTALREGHPASLGMPKAR
jgi:hypothetical protein